jgi:hypothetical protein
MIRAQSQKSADSAYESKRKKATISFSLADPAEAELYAKWQSLPNASAQVKAWLSSLPIKLA